MYVPMECSLRQTAQVVNTAQQILLVSTASAQDVHLDRLRAKAAYFVKIAPPEKLALMAVAHLASLGTFPMGGAQHAMSVREGSRRLKESAYHAAMVLTQRRTVPCVLSVREDMPGPWVSARCALKAWSQRRIAQSASPAPALMQAQTGCVSDVVMALSHTALNPDAPLALPAGLALEASVACVAMGPTRMTSERSASPVRSGVQAREVSVHFASTL